MRGRLLPTACSRLAAGRRLCWLLAVVLLCLCGHNNLLLSRLLFDPLGSSLLCELGLRKRPVDSHCSASQLLQHSLAVSLSIGRSEGKAAVRSHLAIEQAGGLLRVPPGHVCSKSKAQVGTCNRVASGEGDSSMKLWVGNQCTAPGCLLMNALPEGANANRNAAPVA